MEKDGVLDSVVNGKTGVFFYEQTSESLKDAILNFEKMTFDKVAIRKNALRFDEKVFQENNIESCNKSCFSHARILHSYLLKTRSYTNSNPTAQAPQKSGCSIFFLFFCR